MNEPCGCCEGIESLTPLPTANRPGLDALRYRAGTHATFLETMLARLSSRDYPPLHGLTTRQPSDPAIALLDAWAMVADVLTFYQERIANEGYLRTATERRSVLELARLVGYTLRPGVAASTYLAYVVDENTKDEVMIKKGARVQSVPGPGELPQAFETSEDLMARARWNTLKPRMTQPQTATSIKNDPQGGQPKPAVEGPHVYLEGITTNLKPNDPLLIEGISGDDPAFVRVKEVQPDAAAGRTLVTLQGRTITPSVSERGGGNIDPSTPQTVWPGGSATFIIEPDSGYEIAAVKAEGGSEDSAGTWTFQNVTADRTIEATFKLQPGMSPGVSQAVSTSDAKRQIIESLLKSLTTPPSPSLANGSRLMRSLGDTLAPSGDTLLQILRASGPRLGDALPGALATAKVTPDSTIKVYAPRVKASLFGHNAQKRQRLVLSSDSSPETTETEIIGEWPIVGKLESAGAKIQIDDVNALPAMIAAIKNDQSEELLKALNAYLSVHSEPVLTSWAQVAKRDYVASGANDGHANALIRDGFSAIALSCTIKMTTGDLEGNFQRGRYPSTEEDNTIYLDAAYNKIIPSSWVVVDASAVSQTEKAQVKPSNTSNNSKVVITKAISSQSDLGRAEYGMSGKTTRVELDDNWIGFLPNDITEVKQEVYNEDFQVIRHTVVYAQFEELSLAEEPVETPICGDDAIIELDGLYNDLQPGRWLIVSGERVIEGSSGVKDSELVMLAEVTHDWLSPGDRQKQTEETPPAPLPGDKTHTYIKLQTPLAYCYKRDTVTIYGNVVKATHGETRNEVLGSGDGSKSSQTFTLKQPPLTYVAAVNSTGAENTLEVRVNDIQWYEVDSLAALGPTDRRFITRTDDEGKTAIILGNGQRGARPPTGTENIRARYRSGIGKGGNVKAGQLSLLATRPLGVKEVTNPLPATGGGDKEGRDQARRNAPLAVMALDRLVSVRDYADFARTFAGISKASAARLSDGQRQVVHVTIAGADDIPIGESSDLFRALRLALHELGDPYQPIQLAVRELLLIVLSARVRVQPEYQWETVAPKIRAALLEAFGFARRALGQDVLLSEVVSVIQGVAGVAYVDVDALDALDQEAIVKLLPDPGAAAPPPLTLTPRSRVPIELARPAPNATGPAKPLLPAQIAYLTPDVPETLILNVIER